jgi:tetratricopeptide (TPR) repeat protein
MTTMLERASANHDSGRVSVGLRRVVALRFFVMRRPVVHLLATAFAALSIGCAGVRSTDSPRTPADPARIDVPRTVITPDSATSLPEMFAAAEAKAREGKLEGAAALYDRVVEHEPQGPLAAQASFRSGEAHDNLGQHQAAIARYRAVVEKHPGHELAREAALRCVRLLAYVEDFAWAGRFADRLLEQKAELRPIEEIVAYGGKALALVAEGDDVRALSFVERGRDVIERNNLDLAGRLPRDLAQLYFALGEVYRLRGERIRFVPAPQNLAVTLEERCRLVLDAQRAYSDTWRAYDAHWSSMAGFRVGELYQKLHEDLMALEAPASADTKSRQNLYEAAMRLRFEVLLEKARGMMEHTVAMAEREGEKSTWVERAREAKARIELAEKAEREALARLPYTKEELQAVLDELGQKAKAKSKKSQP